MGGLNYARNSALLRRLCYLSATVYTRMQTSIGYPSPANAPRKQI